MPLMQYTNTATDMFNLNFNALFQGATTVTSQADGPYSTAAMDLNAGTTVFHLDAHVLNIDTYVRITGSGLNSVLWGTGFVFNGFGAVTDGTISMMIGPAAGFSGLSLTGVDLSVADYLAAAQTATNEDDFQLMRHLFRGNDMILGSDQNDRLLMGGGKDLFNDYGGSDVVWGGRGDDLIQSGNGGDTLHGGEGNDILTNFATNAHLRGGAGDDTIQGGWDKDHMQGGEGADRFCFLSNQGHDVVADFTQGQDKLVLMDFAAAFADLTVEQIGADAKLSFGRWSVLLKNVDHLTLTDSDFAFNQPNFLEAGEIAFFTGWDYVA